MASEFFELDCGDGETITVEVNDQQEIIFHDWDEEGALAAVELGFEPSRCFKFKQVLDDSPSPLISVATVGHADMVEIVLAAGGQVRLWDYGALMDAIRNGHAAVVRLLLAGDSSIHQHFQDPEQFPLAGTMSFKPLDLAITSGHDHIVALLLQSRIYYDEEDLHSALWLAAGDGDRDIVLRLLHAGADPSAHRRESVYQAAREQQYHIVDLLETWIREHG